MIKEILLKEIKFKSFVKILFLYLSRIFVFFVFKRYFDVGLFFVG